MNPSTSPSILVIRLSSLGDVVLASSVPEAVRARVPGARISFLTKECFADVLENNPNIYEILTVSESGSSPGSAFALGRDLRAERFDFVLDLQSNPRTVLLGLMASAGRLVSSDKDSLFRHGLVRFKGLRPRRLRHVVQRYLGAAEKVFGPVPASRPAIFLTEAESRAGLQLLHPGVKDGNRSWIGLCPGARWNTKMWGVERMALLADRLLGAGFGVVALGGPQDEAVLRRFESLLSSGHDVKILNSNLRTLASVMSWCRCVVSNDSGLMHLAHASGTAVVAIFGPTVPEFGFYPPDSYSVVFSNEFDCKPCDVHGTEKCKTGDMRCMASVGVEDVFGAVLDVAEKSKAVRHGRTVNGWEGRRDAFQRRLETPTFRVVRFKTAGGRTEWKIPESGLVGVRVPNWVGDAVMARPALSVLSRLVGEERLVLVAHRRVVGLFEDRSMARELFVVPSERRPRLLRDGLALRKHRLTLCMAMPDSLSSAVQMWLAGARERIGFRGQLRDALLTTGLDKPRWLHLSEEYARLLPSGSGYEGFVPLVAQDSELKLMEKRLLESGVKKDSRLVLLAPGAAYGETKRWPAERFIQLAEFLRRLERAQLVLLGTGSESGLCDAIARGSQVPALNIAGKTSLRELVAISSMATAFVGNDSGSAHVAAAAGCPTVVIVGSSDPSWTTPRGAVVEVVRRRVSCSPCFLKKCPYGIECLTEIQPDHVYEALLRTARSLSFGLHGGLG